MSNEIIGTLPVDGTIKGNLAAVYGKDGKNAYEVAVKNGFEGTETEWLESLKGEKGDVGEKGDIGEAFTYEDFTPEQLASLKGEKGDPGDKGDTGKSGVYLGSGDMPDDCKVQIDPSGEVFEITHETGNSETKVMSQKGVTDAVAYLEKSRTIIDSIVEETQTANLLNEKDPDHITGKYLSPPDGVSERTDATRNTSGYISVSEGENLLVSQYLSSSDNRDNMTRVTRIYGYDSDKNYIQSSYAYNTGLEYYTVPTGVSFLRFSYDVGMYSQTMIVKGTEYSRLPSSYVPYSEYYTLKDGAFPSKLSAFENDCDYATIVKKPLALPSNLYAFVGVPVSLYHYNIMDYNPDDVYIRMTTLNKGKLKKRKWEYTPESAETTPIKYNIFNHDYDCLNDNETVNLVVKDTSEKASLKVLVIGDSTVQANTETQTMLDLANTDNYGLTLLGTRGEEESENQHEGRGGWTAEMYVNNASNTSGRVTNAFYNPTTSTFDFSYYMTQQGYDGVDCVFIQLGINDLFSAKTDKELETAQNTFYENIDKMIQSIHAYDSNIKIVLNTIIPSDTDQDAFCETYGMVQTVWRNHHNVYLSNRKTIERYAETSNVYVSWYSAMIDCDNNMTGDVHPNNDGYTELGTQMYGFMRAIN